MMFSSDLQHKCSIRDTGLYAVLRSPRVQGRDLILLCVWNPPTMHETERCMDCLIHAKLLGNSHRLNGVVLLNCQVSLGDGGE